MLRWGDLLHTELGWPCSVDSKQADLRRRHTGKVMGGSWQILSLASVFLMDAGTRPLAKVEMGSVCGGFEETEERRQTADLA